MEIIDLIVAASAVLIVIAVIHYNINKKKKGKSTGCGGGCSGCSMSGQCMSSQYKFEKGEKK